MQSTTGVYMPGVGTTITRANIEAEQARRVKEGLPPAEPEQIVELFVKKPAEPRHLARATRLMNKG